MEAMIPELLDMRKRACPGGMSRRRADRCLELCFQELAANDETLDAGPCDLVEDLLRTLMDARG